jgi:hypothetical protein
MAGDESDQKCGQWLVTKVTAFFINYFDGGSGIKKYLKKPSLSSLPLLRLPWLGGPRLCWRLVEKAVTFVTTITVTL